MCGIGSRAEGWKVKEDLRRPEEDERTKGDENWPFWAAYFFILAIR
jgi:hypothetical protein